MKKYPSAVDWWLAAMLIGVPAAIIANGIYLMFAKSAAAGAPLGIAGLFTGELMALFSIPCVYTIDGDRLKIRCGIVSYNVPLAEIRSVEKSNSIWSAPALSLRRVLIKTDTRSYLISPRNRDEFMAEILERMDEDDGG